jgi:hypothetical protein
MAVESCSEVAGRLKGPKKSSSGRVGKSHGVCERRMTETAAETRAARRYMYSGRGRVVCLLSTGSVAKGDGDGEREGELESEDEVGSGE